MNIAPANSGIAPGTILAGKYRVAKVLGQGGMGVVVEAHHIQLDDRVALKFLLPEYATHPEASERFLREARAAVKIKSEHVARVSDVGTLDNGAPYMVMEYLDGSDLSSILEKKGPMPVPEAIEYVLQACEAINEAHSYGIVHRDIKPANLFVTKRQDGGPLVKVLDFGISKTIGSGVDGLTRTTATMGSALYMSPEQMRQSRSVDHRTDIYSLGITLYELLAGKQPFYANTLPELCAEVLTGNPTPLRELRADIPHEFAVVLERSYARNLEHRCQNITEFVFSLAPFAPPRSQEVLDFFARMANVPAPRAGVPSAGPPPDHMQTASGYPTLQQIQAGPYNTSIPNSQRSTAAFAHGPPAGMGSTNASAFTSTTRTSSGGGAVIGIVAGLLVLVGGGAAGAYYLMKAKQEPPKVAQADSPNPAKTAEVLPIQTTATATAAASVAATPPPSASVEASAAPSSDPKTDKNPKSNTRPPGGNGKIKPDDTAKVVVTPTPTPTPPTTSKTTDGSYR